MSGVHYLPNHRHTRFKEFRAAPMTVTNVAAEEIVTLPLFVDQTDAQVDAVIDAVNTFSGTRAPHPAPTRATSR